MASDADRQEALRRAGRLREQAHEDELEVFERRNEWFQRFHASPTEGAGRLHEQALRQALHLESLPPPTALDPGGDPPEGKFAAVNEDAQPYVRFEQADNPARSSGLGFVDEPFDVTFDADELTRGCDVKVALAPEELRHVAPETVRAFRFDEDSDRWVLVPRSGLARAGRHAWLRAHRPGRYALAGLPRDAALLYTVTLLHALRPQLAVARERDAAERLVEAVTAAVFAGESIQKLSGPMPPGLGPGDLPDLPDLGDLGGIDLPADGLELGEIRDLLDQIDLGRRGLVEWDILQDLCPPYGKRDWPPETIWPRPLPLPPLFLRWTSVGPRNVNGRIKCLAIHPTNPDLLWAGAANGGVWYSRDAGATWDPSFFNELSLAIGALAVSQSDPTVLYAATGEDTPGWSPAWPGVGVYRSDNGGLSWTLTSPIPSIRCTKVLIHPSDAYTVYVAGDGGLHKSTNGGGTWTDVRTDHVTDALMDPTAPDRIYAGVWNDGVYRSTNGGATWTRLEQGILSGASADWIKLAMGRHGTNGTSYLLAKMGSNSGSLYRSTNGGDRWVNLAGGLQPASYNEWTNMIAIDPANHDRLLAGGVGLSRSTNGGLFSAVGGTHSDHQQAVYTPSNTNVVYVATDGGVYRSTDAGATWQLRSHMLVATQLYSIGVSESALVNLGAATQDQGIIRTPGGLDWYDSGAGNEGGIFVVDPNDYRVCYATPWDGNLRRSTDEGTTWTTILNGLGSPAPTVMGLAVRPGNSSRLLGIAGTGVFTSSDQGNNWSSAATVAGNATQVVVARSNADVCFVATDAGRVYRSTSGGAAGSWSEPYAAADRPPIGTIGALAVSDANTNLLFIGFAGFGMSHVWRSTDGGVHWQNASGAAGTTLPDIPVNALVIDPDNSDAVYAATDIGVFRTRDGGTTWESWRDGMPHAFVSGLVLRRRTKMLYASTMGRGAWARRTSA
jgi:hypothetical protein